MSDNLSETPFAHIFQKTGLLISFGVSKEVSASEIRELKLLIREATKSEKMRKQMFDEELSKLAEFDSVPGLIYIGGDAQSEDKLTKLSAAVLKKIKRSKLNKSQMCFLINSLVDALELENSDFDQLNDELFGPDGDEA